MPRKTIISAIIILIIISCSLSCRNHSGEAQAVPAPSKVRTGADQILEEPYFSWIKGKGIGLITNQTGVTSSLTGLPEIL